MPSRRITYRGCKFEVWEKSMRFVEPFVSTLFHSPNTLDNYEAERFAESLIKLANQGAEYIEQKRKNFRLGDYP
jgi:hypothetical protein